MRHTVTLTENAVRDFKRLPAFHRAAVRDAMKRHLHHEPQKIGPSRIKRLRGDFRAQYRLRVGEIRVFYRIEGDDVIVLGIVAKSEQDQWLRNQQDSDDA
jgi:mRNA-degrading endonuclease RelE of RelBE toxin-antitoxin system